MSFLVIFSNASHLFHCYSNNTKRQSLWKLSHMRLHLPFIQLSLTASCGSQVTHGTHISGYVTRYKGPRISSYSARVSAACEAFYNFPMSKLYSKLTQQIATLKTLRSVVSLSRRMLAASSAAHDRKNHARWANGNNFNFTYARTKQTKHDAGVTPHTC